ncbi:hypothetical protein L484_009526 [Morus notabilis]|uniref:HMA domain-containing protein n=1 Tax=Morus notabilis TaxID=981085 RepID=W9REN6_9ROSA|nr:heavy metal-associated isoprenylated plant protein 34 [Morus notabilis]EXB67446.1 hypothetical protein L484_009526 [Morus notabilis]
MVWHWQSCELKVNTKSRGWHKTLTKMFGRIKEVSYTIDGQTGIARVSGRIDPHKILKLLEKAGKHAELLKVDSGHHQYGTTAFVDENGYHYSPGYSHYEPTTPPLPLPPPPSHHTYYEPGFQHQPPPMDPYHDPHSRDSKQCPIM